MFLWNFRSSSPEKVFALQLWQIKRVVFTATLTSDWLVWNRNDNWHKTSYSMSYILEGSSLHCSLLISFLHTSWPRDCLNLQLLPLLFNLSEERKYVSLQHYYKWQWLSGRRAEVTLEHTELPVKRISEFVCQCLHITTLPTRLVPIVCRRCLITHPHHHHHVRKYKNSKTAKGLQHGSMGGKVKEMHKLYLEESKWKSWFTSIQNYKQTAVDWFDNLLIFFELVHFACQESYLNVWAAILGVLSAFLWEILIEN